MCPHWFLRSILSCFVLDEFLFPSHATKRMLLLLLFNCYSSCWTFSLWAGCPCYDNFSAVPFDFPAALLLLQVFLMSKFTFMLMLLSLPVVRVADGGVWSEKSLYE